jgi:S-DNA-T family DNA segregation ATPase FtsK/SpoIIIE
MIDTKMLEFSAYDGIPHLLMPVITDPKDAVSALKWVVKEMEDRYRKMSEAGVRNINGYNKKVELENENRHEKEAKLPYIVVIIDEMADLMVVAGKEIEVLVQRLSQMARAAGIHLIMATQRPSVDVITGVIKANFPTRISYQVTSKIDSRTILGEQGAEQLLGKGDMLFMIGGTKTARVHGPMIEDSEVEEVVKFLKKNGAPEYISIVDEDSDDEFASSFGVSDGDDEGLYRKAVKIVLEEKKTSISYLQRKMRIGYNKAANLIEQMEEEGILSSPDVQGKRRILVKQN